MKPKITTKLLKAKVKQWRHLFPALPGVTIRPAKFDNPDCGGLTWTLDNGQALIEVSVDMPSEAMLDIVVLHELAHCVEIAQTGRPDMEHGTSFQYTRARIMREAGIDIGSETHAA
jgi:hypothetical protein